jgi:hypothetical protein
MFLEVLTIFRRRDHKLAMNRLLSVFTNTGDETANPTEMHAANDAFDDNGQDAAGALSDSTTALYAQIRKLPKE